MQQVAHRLTPEKAENGTGALLSPEGVPAGDGDGYNGAMAIGGPGDSPLQDMLVHGRSAGFPDDVVRLVRQLDGDPRFTDAWRVQVDELLMADQPRPAGPGYREPKLAHVRAQLRSIRGRL